MVFWSNNNKLTVLAVAETFPQNRSIKWELQEDVATHSTHIFLLNFEEFCAFHNFFDVYKQKRRWSKKWETFSFFSSKMTETNV